MARLLTTVPSQRQNMATIGVAPEARNLTALKNLVVHEAGTPGLAPVVIRGPDRIQDLPDQVTEVIPTIAVQGPVLVADHHAATREVLQEVGHTIDAVVHTPLTLGLAIQDPVLTVIPAVTRGLAPDLDTVLDPPEVSLVHVAKSVDVEDPLSRYP